MDKKFWILLLLLISIAVALVATMIAFRDGNPFFLKGLLAALLVVITARFTRYAVRPAN